MRHLVNKIGIHLSFLIYWLLSSDEYRGGSNGRNPKFRHSKKCESDYPEMLFSEEDETAVAVHFDIHILKKHDSLKNIVKRFFSFDANTFIN